MGFIETIIEKAKSDRKTIVLPEAGDIRTLQAAAELQRREIADVILIGEEKAVADLAAGLDISRTKIINPMESPLFDSFADEFTALRQHKGMTREKAAIQMRNPLFFAVMLVKQGLADGMVAGAVNSTPDVLRPALQILKTAPGTKLVSAFFMMVVPDCRYGADGTFLFADSGLVENPDAGQLAEIAISSADSFEKLTGKEAEVAMLSYSTYGSANSELTQKVIEATRIAQSRAPARHIDGELQLDAAIVPQIGSSKAPGSKVAGKANVLIFPDLNSGNIGYKLVQRLAGAEAYGPVTQGISRPVNDLSRGCSSEDIVGVAAITAVQAQRG